MAYKHCLIFTILVCFETSGLAQGSHLTAILSQSESYQRQFVSDFLKDAAPTGYVQGYPKTSAHDIDFGLLMEKKDWGLPMAEATIVEWMKDPSKNKDVIERVVGIIAYSGTIRSLEFTARVFKNWPNAKRWISQSLYSHMGSANPNYFTLWYYAVESKDPLIQEAAMETITSISQHPISEGDLETWSEALIDRIKREPTTLDSYLFNRKQNYFNNCGVTQAAASRSTIC